MDRHGHQSEERIEMAPTESSSLASAGGVTSRHAARQWLPNPAAEKSAEANERNQARIAAGVCMEWRDTGKCEFGENCHFSH